jgi:hypothetical protein
MKKNSRIRFNPVTMEIEVEGAEAFVKTCFERFQAMIPGSSLEKATTANEPKTVKAALRGKAEMKPKAKVSPDLKAPKAPKAVKPQKARKAKKPGKKAPAKRKLTNIDAVVSLIQGAPGGISTAELKTKSGLNERQIWSIVNRASKGGKIRKAKRGVYGGVAVSQGQKTK